MFHSRTRGGDSGGYRSGRGRRAGGSVGGGGGGQTSAEDHSLCAFFCVEGNGESVRPKPPWWQVSVPPPQRVCPIFFCFSGNGCVRI
jgi:hypothetical protein